MARTRFSRWRERRQREAGNREAVRSGHGLVSMDVPPPVPAELPPCQRSRGGPCFDHSADHDRPADHIG